MKPCAGCLKPTSTCCTKCKIAFYCGPECQRNDWKVHKAECASGCTNYDAREACNAIAAHLAGNPGVRAQFSERVRSNPQAHGIGVVYKNGHEVRLARTTGNLSVEAFFLTEASQYASTPPVSLTGRHPERDYVLLVEVRVPGDTQGLCASVAMAIAH